MENRYKTYRTKVKLWDLKEWAMFVVGGANIVHLNFSANHTQTISNEFTEENYDKNIFEEIDSSIAICLLLDKRESLIEKMNEMGDEINDLKWKVDELEDELYQLEKLTGSEEILGEIKDKITEEYRFWDNVEKIEEWYREYCK